MRVPLFAIATLTLSLSVGCGRVIGNAPAEYAAGDTLLPHDELVIASRALGEDRPVNVYLPDAYAADTSRRFPVLYMPDGGTAEDFPHVTATVDSMIAAGEIGPILVVGFANTVRRRDLTPPTSVAEDRKVAPVVGGAEATRTFLRDELIPEIERRYRVDSTRAVLGESLAGLFIVDTFFEAPDLFDVSLAISPSLWWDGQRRVRDAPGWLAAHPDLEARLYLTHADETDIAPHTAALAEALRAGATSRLDWSYVPRPDLSHGTIYRATKRDALRWAFGRARQGG